MHIYLHTLTILLTVFALLVPGGSNAFTYYQGDAESPYIPSQGLYAPTSAQVYQPLSGTWTLERGNNDQTSVTVPGCWPMGDGHATLRTTFRVADSLAESHFQLVFWGLRQQAEIRLNGQLLEAWDGDIPTVQVDIPRGLLHYSRPNELEIDIKDRLSTRASIPLKPRLTDPVYFAGVYGDVALIARPSATVEELSWHAEVEEDGNRANWEIRLVMRNHASATADSLMNRELAIHAEWTGPDGDTGDNRSANLVLGPVDAEEITISGSIRNPALWSPDDPNLYRFNVIVEEGDLSWNVPVDVGFSTVEWTEQGVSINGRSLRVRGIDVRMTNRVRGAAMSVDEIREDLVRIKDAGFNLVRYVYDMPHPVVAEICDELGLFLVPQTGLHGVPTSVFIADDLQGRIGSLLQEMYACFGTHPSVAAFGIAGSLAPEEAILGTITALQNSNSEMNIPFMVGFATREPINLPDNIVGVFERQPYAIFEPLNFDGMYENPWLVGGLGGYATRWSPDDDSTSGHIRQADALLHQLRSVRDTYSAGFLIGYYADFRSAWPLSIAGLSDDEMIVERGLLTLDREERIGWQKAGEAIGQARIDVPALRSRGQSATIIFPIAALIVGTFLLLSRRQNNVFRQNLGRVFAHTYGFFTDIRNRRYFQTGQTLVIAILVCASNSIFFAGWLHNARTDFAFDYLMTLIFPSDVIKSVLISWAWNPQLAILGFSGLLLGLLIINSIALQMFSIFFKGSLGFRQAFSLSSWGASHFLLLVPFGVVHYRLLAFGWFQTMFTILFALFVLWYLMRIVGMIRIGYKTTTRGAWIFFLLVGILASTISLSIYQGSLAFFDYLEYFNHVILPWTGA